METRKKSNTIAEEENKKTRREEARQNSQPSIQKNSSDRELRLIGKFGKVPLR
jgi:hypothetical protein